MGHLKKIFGRSRKSRDMGCEQHHQMMQEQSDVLRKEMEARESAMKLEQEKQVKDLKDKMEKMNKDYQELRNAEIAREKHAEELRNYPIPEWMNSHTSSINLGIVGSSGTGKSLLNNKIRGLKNKKQCPDLWAKTGETETTLLPRRYEFPNFSGANLWDLPGVGTSRFPEETYFRDVGLKHFQALIIVCRNRFTENELKLRDECTRLGLPVLFVRTYMDLAIENEEEENDLNVSETMKKVRTYMRTEARVMDPYLLALKGNIDECQQEMDRLKECIECTLLTVKELRKKKNVPESYAADDH